MLEVSLAICLLVVALAAMSASNVGLHGLSRVNREQTIAHNLLRSMAERIQSMSEQARSDPGGWSAHVTVALAPGGEIGDTFDAPELSVPPDVAHGGSIRLVTDETQDDATLQHTLGMPRDLNGDGDAGDLDVRAHARILPVVLTLTWRGRDGIQRLEHAFYLCGF